jgi:diacylglycerol kinase family enzyme
VAEVDSDVDATITGRFHHGERMFVAAGGDGTVNILVNVLARHLSPADLRSVSLGAIGLGSSNDFHKPFDPARTLAGFPCRLNAAGGALYDVGVIHWSDTTGTEHGKYWINNASIGVTAEANYLFNHPTAHLRKIKRWNTDIAILLTALESIAAYTNLTGELSLDAAPPARFAVTNLGIVNNPNFSGSFCYDTPSWRNDGRFSVKLCEAMTKVDMVRLLYSLSHKQFSSIAGTHSREAETAEFAAPLPFAVEFDGETIQTRHARFSLIHQAVRICA